jgi:hypothetical protein
LLQIDHQKSNIRIPNPKSNIHNPTFHMPRLLLALVPLILLCSCASSGRKVIATKHTTLHQSTVVAEYPVTVPEEKR